eukprot:TRINITY_DN64_c0_g2_i2.p1 TRINITY_DN64_c0_g2~~TRINITY_DN64_c0_g2_i2.p1  ORF type:complete len:188 (-),score=27.26 TRINITY_DN64_c0_g2_i2:773-1336(-)
MCIRDRYQRRVRGSLEIAMSLRSGHVKSKRDPLQQKIPQNPKYDHVRSSLDTGCSVTKWMSKNGDCNQRDPAAKADPVAACRPKKDEFFKRIRGSQLVELMDEEDIEVRCGCGRSAESWTAGGECLQPGKRGRQQDGSACSWRWSCGRGFLSSAGSPWRRGVRTGAHQNGHALPTHAAASRHQLLHT